MDIVHLRELAVTHEAEHPHTARVLRDTADKIERLRAVLNKIASNSLDPVAVKDAMEALTSASQRE